MRKRPDRKTYRLDPTLRPRKHSAHYPKVPRRAQAPGPHILEAAADLFAPGEIGQGLARGGEGGVVAHLQKRFAFEWLVVYENSRMKEMVEGEGGICYAGHEQSECSAQREAHDARDEGFAGAGFHAALYLYRRTISSVRSTDQSPR